MIAYSIKIDCKARKDKKEWNIYSESTISFWNVMLWGKKCFMEYETLKKPGR